MQVLSKICEMIFQNCVTIDRINKEGNSLGLVSITSDCFWEIEEVDVDEFSVGRTRYD